MTDSERDVSQQAAERGGGVIRCANCGKELMLRKRTHGPDYWVHEEFPWSCWCFAGIGSGAISQMTGEELLKRQAVPAEEPHE
jgi:hypothetical protein